MSRYQPTSRPRQLGPQVGAPTHGGDETGRLGLDERRQRRRDGLTAERGDVRISMAGLLGAVCRQHARTDDPGGREPRVVDGERLRVAQHLQRRRPAGDQPATQRR
jgi:hypothetical protein